MSVKKFLVLICICIGIAGCATTHKHHPQDYRKHLQSWLGKDESLLLQSPYWGDPEGTFMQPDGSWLYCYKRVSKEDSSGAERFCRTCFYLNQNRIIYRYTYKGNYCQLEEA